MCGLSITQKLGFSMLRRLKEASIRSFITESGGLFRGKRMYFMRRIVFKKEKEMNQEQPKFFVRSYEEKMNQEQPKFFVRSYRYFSEFQDGINEHTAKGYRLHSWHRNESVRDTYIAVFERSLTSILRIKKDDVEFMEEPEHGDQ
jgi:hypothetical protein